MDDSTAPTRRIDGRQTTVVRAHRRTPDFRRSGHSGQVPTAALAATVLTLLTLPALGADDITLADPAPTAGSLFGDAIALHPRWIIVGDRHRRVGPPGALASTGGLVLWSRDDAGLPTGAPVAFEPTGLRRSDRFGESLALAGDLLLVAAPGWEQSPSVADLGRLHVIDLSGATPVSLGFNPLVAVGIRQQFGAALAARAEEDGVFVAVGAPGFVTSGPTPPVGGARGRVYLYRLDAGVWTLQSTYEGASANADSRFGSAVGMNAMHIAVGAPGGAASGPPAWGRVFLFDRNDEKALPLEISAPTPTLDDHFGTSIAMSDELLVVGAPSDACGAGVVHVYRAVRDAWLFEATLEPPANATEDWLGFGSDVALDRQRIMVGTGGIASETAFGHRAAVFRRAGDAWVLEAAIDGSSNGVAPAAGLVALDAAGSLVCEPFGGPDESGALRYRPLPRSADLDFSGSVDASDLAMLLGAWGSVGVLPEDLSGDGVVNASDLALLIGDWSVSS